MILRSGEYAGHSRISMRFSLKYKVIKLGIGQLSCSPNIPGPILSQSLQSQQITSTTQALGAFDLLLSAAFHRKTKVDSSRLQKPFDTILMTFAFKIRFFAAARPWSPYFLNILLITLADAIWSLEKPPKSTLNFTGVVNGFLCSSLMRCFCDRAQFCLPILLFGKSDQLLRLHRCAICAVDFLFNLTFRQTKLQCLWV